MSPPGAAATQGGGGPSGIDLRAPSSYRHWVSVPLRYSDQDGASHVNNTSYVVYCEAAWASLLRKLSSPPELELIVSRLAIDFLQETHFPGTLDVGMAVLGLDEGLLHVAYGIFRDGKPLATARCEHRFWDTRVRRAARPPASLRDVLARECAPQAGAPDARNRAATHEALSAQWDLTDPGTYHDWTPVTVRFSDEDAMRRVQPSAYFAYLEASRLHLLLSFIDIDELDAVLAHIGVDYLHETRFPGTVEVGSRLERVGNRSITSIYGLFREGLCLATARAVNVFFDLHERRAVDPPDAVRAAMNARLDAQKT